MKRIAICDDNALQRQLLADLLGEFYHRKCEKLHLEQYDCGETLVDELQDDPHDLDLIILDIYLPGINGIETAKRLREMRYETAIVFLTASTDFALAGYDVQAAGYLVKPIDAVKLATLLRHIFWKEHRKRIEIKCGKQYRYPYVNDIMYIESSNHKATFYLVDGSEISVIEKISTLKEQINDLHFVQCHQSYLVNMSYIADIQECVILLNGKMLPISARRRAETIETYHNFWNQPLE